MDTNKKIELKLVIDKKRDKVLFAEADTTFVDFLIYTLSLPLSAVAAYLPDGGAPGSTGNLRRSLEKLGEEHYISQHQSKRSILLPHLLTHVPFLRRLTSEINDPHDKIFYACTEFHRYSKRWYCHEVVTDVVNSVCGQCHREMTRTYKFTDSLVQTRPAKYVKDVVKYMVTDELSVLPLDATSVVEAVKGCGSPGDVADKYVEFGPPQALDLLKAVVLQSEKVLTTVFLQPK